MHPKSNSRPPLQSAGNEKNLLQLIKQLMDELHPDMRYSRPVTLDSSLDRDLGLDSLARVELLARLEQQFDLSLSEHVLATTESPRDLLRHIGLSKRATPAPQVRQIVSSEDSDETDLAPQGWLHTGDVVKMENSDIHIRGRLKEIIVTSTGEKVPPADLEMTIGGDPLVDHVMVIGEGMPYLAALLVLHPSAWETLAGEMQAGSGRGFDTAGTCCTTGCHQKT